jgi:hypothetical protein
VAATVDRSQPARDPSKHNAVATSAVGQSWPAAPWQEPMLPLRCVSGLATVTDAATMRVRSGRYTVLKIANSRDAPRVLDSRESPCWDNPKLF